MEDSLSSSYDGPRSRSKQKASRGGPEGHSLGTPKQKQTKSTPATSGTRSKTRSRSKTDSDYSSENLTPGQSPKGKGKRKNIPAGGVFQDGDGNSFGSMDSKRSRLSSEGCSMDSDSKIGKKKKEKKVVAPKTDVSWEMAVEKARGLPDGAFENDEDSEDESDEMDEDEIDVDAPDPRDQAKSKTPKKAQNEEGKSNPLSVIQCVAKKLKPRKSKGSESESPKKAKKRKSEEDLNEAADKKKSKDEKKDRKLQRKMTKNNYDLGTKAKSMWEELRRFDLPHEKRHQLSTDLYNLVKGKAKELIFAHDTSRVIQCMMKYGLQEHKNAIFEELREIIVEMSKSKYAKFFVRKLLKYGTKAQRNYVFRKLYGNVRKLLKHKEAAEIVECAYNNYANVAQRNALVEEFYGPSFALFKTSEQKSLDQIIQSNPEKRDSILSNMKEALTGLMEKTVLHHSIVHRVFWEFFFYSTDKLKAEMIETVREAVIHMLHTRDGSRVAMLSLWYGTAKDRKVIIKSFKTYVEKICKEEYGHLVMLALFDVVDDTKLVQKAMLEELLKSTHALAQDQYGRKVLLYLLAPRDPVHFHGDIVKILQQGDGNPNSKKDPEIRHRELLEYVSRPLIQYVGKHSKELMTSNGSLVLLLAIITHAKTDPTDAMRAVSQLAAEPFVAGSLDNHHIVEHTAGHLTLKKLILNDAQRLQNGESVLFSGILLDILPEGSLKSWAACNRGCFILISLLELKHADTTRRVQQEIVPIKNSLKKMDFKGSQILLNKLGLL